VRVVHFPLVDDGSRLTASHLTRLRALSKALAGELERGQCVLVTCHAGWNRSGLVTAATLMAWLHAPASDAIDLVRAKRGGHALRNAAFLDTLKNEKVNRAAR